MPIERLKRFQARTFGLTSERLSTAVLGVQGL